VGRWNGKLCGCGCFARQTRECQCVGAQPLGGHRAGRQSADYCTVGGPPAASAKGRHRQSQWEMSRYTHYSGHTELVTIAN
jgi:hypothetical protein